MKAAGAIFEEPPVHSDKGDRHTNDICSKNSESSYTIDGTEINFPVVVADASMLMNGFLVDARAAQAMLEGTGFRVVELLPGKAILQLLAVDYKENDLGDYNEGAIIFPVLTPGMKKPFPFFGALKRMASGTIGNFVYRMPVDQEFTTHAGRFIWGFPKWVSRIDIEFGAQIARGTFIDEDELVYSIAAKTGGKSTPKEQRAASLAIRDGRAWKTYGTNNSSGMTFSLGGETPEIGDRHPLAKELRALGLPKKPMFTVSVESTRMTFGKPESCDIGAPFST
ncbi:MAG: acetoacetate decarboxylase family protein [Halioglobus sp.]